MKNMQLHDVEFESVVVDQDPNLVPLREDGEEEEEEGDMWLDRDPRDLLGVDDSSIFYSDFPPLPDFPCISSSSSSSPSPPTPALAPANLTACRSSSSTSSSSSSSSASWTILKSDAEGVPVEKKNDYHHMDAAATVQQQTLLSKTDSMEIQPSLDPQIDVDCIDVMQELGDMDLLDTNDMWDPNFIFPYENLVDDKGETEQQQQMQQEEGLLDEPTSEDDLGMVFLEWLKSNKESISAEDLRSIRLKKSTIECAAHRLGGGKEGMKQLLKLILEWVQNHHLHKRRMRAGGGALEASCSPDPYHPHHFFQNLNPYPNPISPDSHLCFSPPAPWIPHPPYYANLTAAARFPSMLGYMGDPTFVNGAPFTHPDYPMIDSAATWPPPLPPHFALYNSYRGQHLNPAPTQATAQLLAFGSGSGSDAFGNQYSCHTQMVQGHEEGLVKMGSSATKEARKKRMARQRRFLSHHHHQRQYSEQHARINASDANCTTTASHANPGGGNWVFWPTTAISTATTAAVMPSEIVAATSSDRPPLQQHHQRQVISDRRQGWKQEKNLRFLLQKVLKQSDVGNLGRIVLPKKEAETHLPELEARDGISIAMEDIGTSRIWNMRYRFWPNNKSRMYLLENTGDFVRSNGLQEGDFIVIYSDIKCGKYMIRGVKVRQHGSKMEAKRTGKPQRNLHATSPSQAHDGGPSSSSPIKGTVT